MSNTDSSEENIKSPSTYGNEAYQRYRKKEKKKNKTGAEKEALSSVMPYTKYAVGGESKEVPASPPQIDENDNLVHRGQQNQPKQGFSKKK